MPKKPINPMDRHVGQQIRIARLALGMSQEKLGDALDLTFQQVQKYEKGTNRVSGSRLQQIANVLKVSGVEAFFKGGPGYNNDKKSSAGEPSIYELMSTSGGLQLAKLWPKVSPKTRHLIIELVEVIVEGQ